MNLFSKVMLTICLFMFSFSGSLSAQDTVPKLAIGIDEAKANRIPIDDNPKCKSLCE